MDTVRRVGIVLSVADGYYGITEAQHTKGNEMFAVMNNRGSQIALCNTKPEAQEVADEFNARGLDVFAWVVEAQADAKAEDMPGRGFIYG